MRIKDLIQEILYRRITRMKAAATGNGAGYFIHVSIRENGKDMKPVGVLHVTPDEVCSIITPTGDMIMMRIESA